MFCRWIFFLPFITLKLSQYFMFSQNKQTLINQNQNQMIQQLFANQIHWFIFQIFNIIKPLNTNKVYHQFSFAINKGYFYLTSFSQLKKLFQKINLFFIFKIQNIYVQNLIPMKRTPQLSRFSQKINPDIFKNLQTFQSKDNTDNATLNQTDFKKSIYTDEKKLSKDLKDLQDSMRQNKEQDLFTKENSGKKEKFYEIEELKAYRQTMVQLPFLNEKPKKIKFKHICVEFIEFLFQIMKSIEFIQKIFSSFVDNQAIVNEFANITNGFQLKKYPAGKTIEIGKDEEFFYIFIEGIIQKSIVKIVSKLEKKSFCENLNSSTSLARRRGSKTKTITEKGKNVCFEGNIPILINEKQFTQCSLITVDECTFLLLEKSVWCKFMSDLQKLEQKQLVAFVKQWTSINLSICTINQLANKDGSMVERKPFLYQMKHKSSIHQNDESYIMSDEDINDRKAGVNTYAISLTYNLFSLAKDQRMEIDNQNVYLVVKGSTYLTTKIYSIIINEGSIINTSILLSVELQSVNIKALTECTIVKLILDEIYLKKEQQNQFIKKIQEIQEFRSQIIKIPHSNTMQSFIQKPIIRDLNQLSKSKLLNSQNSVSKIEGKVFEPPHLRMGDINISKADRNRSKNFVKSRICHRYQSIKTQPDEDDSVAKVAVKFANNYCIFQKIVQSKEKVTEAFRVNTVNKVFPIKTLLQNSQFRKSINLKSLSQRQQFASKENSSIKQFNLSPKKQQTKQESQISEYFLEAASDNPVSSFCIPSQQNHKCRTKKLKKKTDLKSLKERREKFQKILLQRKKKEKAKIIQHLFQISFEKQIQKNKLKSKNQNLRFSTQTHLDRISEMKRINSQGRFSKIKDGQISFDFFQKNFKKQSNDDLFTRSTSRGKYQRNFLVIEPNYGQMKNIQKIISGQNIFTRTKINNLRNSEGGTIHLRRQNYISNQFLQMKKMVTRKVKTSMLNGRLRQSKKA